MRYRPNTTGSILEHFDPDNPDAPGEDITGFSRTLSGISGGTITLAGFYLDSLLVSTMEGNPDDETDANHLRYKRASVFVYDITVQDPATLETLTIAGVFGMNFLVASTDADLDCLLAGLCPTTVGAFNWIALDFSCPDVGVMGLDVKRIYQLQPGLNLFSYPGAVPSVYATCRALLAGLGGSEEVESISRLNASDRQFVTCARDAGQDFDIVAGVGYMVRMRKAKAVVLSADATCPEVTLKSGVNLIGHPVSSKTLSCYSLLESLGESVVASLQRLNTQRGSFESCAFADKGGSQVPVGVDFPVRVGEGYLLHSLIEGPIALPGCL